MINKYKVNYSITSDDGIIYGEAIMKSNTDTEPSHFEALNYLHEHSRELAIAIAIPGRVATPGNVVPDRSGLSVISVQLIEN